MACIAAPSFSLHPPVPFHLLGERTHAEKAAAFRLIKCSATTSDDKGGLDFNASCVMSRRNATVRAVCAFTWIFNASELFSYNLSVRSRAIGEESELEIIRSEVRKVLTKTKAAGMLRLVFHDAGTFNATKNSGGMNGSIIYELDRPENAGLSRPIKVLEKVKASLHPSIKVSWADLISVAGAEAVAICGGPKISLKLGRLDVVSPDPEGQLPAESLDATSLKKFFKDKGFLTQELVVLSGAHTLGSKGFGDPTVFDNSYFQILLERPWNGSGMAMMIGLPSDRTLVDDDECVRWVKFYANDEQQFFNDFSAAYMKLVNSGAHWRALLE